LSELAPTRAAEPGRPVFPRVEGRIPGSSRSSSPGLETQSASDLETAAGDRPAGRRRTHRRTPRARGSGGSPAPFLLRLALVEDGRRQPQEIADQANASRRPSSGSTRCCRVALRLVEQLEILECARDLQPRPLVRLQRSEIAVVVPDAPAIAGHDAGDAVEERRLNRRRLGPISPRISPCWSVKDTPDRAWTPPKASSRRRGLANSGAIRPSPSWARLGRASGSGSANASRRVGEPRRRWETACASAPASSGTTPLRCDDDPGGSGSTRRSAGTHSVESGVWVSSSGPEDEERFPPTAAAPMERTPTTIAIATTASELLEPVGPPRSTEPIAGSEQGRRPDQRARPTPPNAASFHAVTFTAARRGLRSPSSGSPAGTRPVFDLLRFQTARPQRGGTPRG